MPENLPRRSLDPGTVEAAFGELVASVVDPRKSAWHGRRVCPVCEGDHRHQAFHPRLGRRLCRPLVVAEFHLTLADGYWCVKCKEGVQPPGVARIDPATVCPDPAGDSLGEAFRDHHWQAHPEHVVRGEPTVGLLRQALRWWVHREGRGVPMRAVFVEEQTTGGGARGGVRGRHPHAHGLCMASTCVLELQRLRWSMTVGNARRGRMYEAVDDPVFGSWPEHLGRYEAKHAGKEAVAAHSSSLRSWWHSEVKRERGELRPFVV